VSVNTAGAVCWVATRRCRSPFIESSLKEVRMQFIRLGAAKASSDLISGILNCVCPECGGSMGGVGREFKCQGQCQTDWRQIWERVRSAGLNRRTTRTIRPS
jgi:hypothetical protein